MTTSWCLAVSLSPANAQTPDTLWTRCTGNSDVDVACRLPRGIAADPSSGHVFVSDQTNKRVVEFDALGTFVRAWGWDVVVGGGNEFEVCVPANGDECQAGTEGAGPGQFNGVQGIAIDSSGDVYVVDRNNNRVQKFDEFGHFLASFGNAGAGNGQFGSWPVGSFIGIDTKGTGSDADDRIYVGDVNRIQVFDTSGAYLESLPLPGETVQSLAVDGEGDLYATYAGKPDVRKLNPAGVEIAHFELPKAVGAFEYDQHPTAVAVDSAGDVYAFGYTQVPEGGSPKLLDPIFEFDPAGNLIANFGKEEYSASTGLATNLCAGDEAPGNLYVSNAVLTSGLPSDAGHAFVRAYGPEPRNCGKAITEPASDVTETAARLNGNAIPKGEAVTECRFEYGPTKAYGSIAPCAQSEAEIGQGDSPVPVFADVSGLDPGSTYHFRLVIGTVGGAEGGADEAFKTLGPPVLSAEAATSVTYTEAMLRARVNPEGFATKYRFEYGLDAGYGHSTPEIEVGSNGDRADHPVSADLSGLLPGTTYHWRIVAANASSEKAGSPTIGPDHTFTTYRRAEAESCPNDALRGIAAAGLPDCRAYEMVSPVDKNGGNIDLHYSDSYVQASREGDALTYTSAAAFGDVKAVVLNNQYLAQRDPSAGWLNRGIRPAVKGRSAAPRFGIFREFMAFSPDLCSAWFDDPISPPLTEEGQDGYVNFFRLDLCAPEESPEALTSVPPPPGTEVTYVNVLAKAVAGYSDDARHVVFAARAALAPRAANGSKAQVYDRFDGGLHLVSIRPSGVAETENTRVGSGTSNNLDNAISADGEHVYWTAGGDEGVPTGTIYLRIHPGEDKSAEGECEAGRGCTVRVGGTNLFPAFFWAAADDGSRALFGEAKEGGEKLSEFSLQRFEENPSTARRVIAEHVVGVLGASDDLSRIYFVSTSSLAAGATEGQPNLYLDEGGSLTFVATLSPGDVASEGFGGGRAYSLAAKSPLYRAVRVSADGSRLAFESRAQLTGFDNADPDNGEADLEVFLYEVGDGLHCVSCNPSGAAASGPELHEAFAPANMGTGVFAAAWIPTWEHSTHASRALSGDGSRLFFHSYEALVPFDTNGAMDVYEWEAPGTGSCTTEKAAFHGLNGGCVYLISSGTSPGGAEFFDASVDGRDVFFNTEASLVPRDPGLVDLYDARVGGGFPEPTEKAECEGDACQGPPSPPRLATPASRSYDGPPNPGAARDCTRQARRAAGLSRLAGHLRQVAHNSADEVAARRMLERARRLAKRARELNARATRCRRANQGGSQ